MQQLQFKLPNNPACNKFENTAQYMENECVFEATLAKINSCYLPSYILFETPLGALESKLEPH